jgi:HEAT repeat protein
MRRRCLQWSAVLFLVLSSVIAAAAQTSAPLSSAAPTLLELGKHAQDTNRPEAERLALVKLLGEWGTAQVREPLVAVLKDPLPSIREAAARALGWQGNREAVSALGERVKAAGETPAVRAAALESLGKIGDDSVRDTVLAATNDPDAKIRGAALGALTTGLLASPTDRIPLLRRVAEDRALDLLMRCEAIQALGTAQDTGATQLLVRLLENEPRIANPLPSAFPNQQEVLAVRFREARDVAAWAAATLGLIQAREALPLLLKSAEDPDDFFLRLTSVGALVAWKAPEAVPVLVRRLGDPFPDVRARALAGLAQAGDRSVTDAVLARLSDQVAWVRIQAIAALVELGDPRARAEFERLSKEELDSDVQRALRAALARLAH